MKALYCDVLSANREGLELDQILEEQAVKYDSKSNGDAENAVKQVTKQLRTLKLCLESRIGQRVPTSHPFLTWLVEHSAWTLNTRVLGTDGATPYQQVKGKNYAKRGVGFGEYVMYMLPTKGAQQAFMGKLDSALLLLV